MRIRKQPELWQAFQIWDEFMHGAMKHKQRREAILAGKSNLSLSKEEEAIYFYEQEAKVHAKILANEGAGVGPIWAWLTAIRGIGEHTAAKLLALYDDVGRFDNISRFCVYGGYGMHEYWVNEKGKRMAPVVGKRTFVLPDKTKEVRTIVPIPEPGWTVKKLIDKRMSGWNLFYDNRLKSELHLVRVQFVMQRTPVYRDQYDIEKARLLIRGGRTPRHIDFMAKRKIIKIFLGHLWKAWRLSEGLPITDPYPIAHLDNHQHYIEPEFELVISRKTHT